MSTKEISAAAQALGRRGGLKSLGAKSKAELSAFGKAAAAARWKKPTAPLEQATKRSNNDRTLAAVAACEQFDPNGSTSDDIHRRHQGDVKAMGGSDWMTFAEVKNALSSLRSKGKVRTSTLPGSRKEKLWRLA